MATTKRHLTAGMDVGAGAVKLVVTRSDAGQAAEVLYRAAERIRRRNVHELASSMWAEALRALGFQAHDFDYVASTGDGDTIEFATGHFYSMTTHARGAMALDPRSSAILDIGALHARAIKADPRGKVTNHRMTSQCASGTGQFVENIARYLGVPLEDVGPLSAASTTSESVSGICAVLAETDVINMVSRGVPTGAILKGIHVSIAVRLAKLLRAIKADGVVFVSGGMAQDPGILLALREAMGKDRGSPVEISSHPDSILTGALGAALLGAYRCDQLERRRLREVQELQEQPQEMP